MSRWPRNNPRPTSNTDVAPLVRKVLAADPTRSYRVGLVIGVLLAVSTALLVIQNGQSARLTWLAWHFRAPLWLILLLAVAAGPLLQPLCALVWRRARRQRADRRAAGQRLQAIADPARSGSTRPAPEFAAVRR